MRLTLRAKLLGGVALYLLLLVAVGLVSTYFQQTGRQRIEASAEHSLSEFRILSDIIARVGVVQGIIPMHLLGQSVEQMAESERIIDRADRDIVSLSSRLIEDELAAGEPESVERIEAFRRAWQLYIGIWRERLAPASYAGRQEEVKALVGVDATFGRSHSTVVDALDAIKERVTAELREKLESAEAEARRLQLLSLLTVGVAAGLGVAVALYFSTQISSAVTAVAGAAAQVAAGDFDQRIEVRTGDELEAMARSFNAMAARLRDMTGDLTERLGREAFYRILVESTSEIIYVVDEQGTIRYASPSLMTVLGFPPEHYAGRNAFDFVDPEEVPDAVGVFTALSTGTANPAGSIRFRLRHRAGEWRTFELVVTDRQDDPALAGFVVVGRDATERVQAEQALRITNERLEAELEERRRIEAELRLARDAALAASRAKTEFLANMSHEIRTPMNAILGMAELLAESPLTAEQQEYVRIFQRSGDTLLRLINEVLDLAKVEAGQLELVQADFGVEELVEQTAEMLAVHAHSKGLELVACIAPDVPHHLTGDLDRLRQILLNLAGNAVKFTGRGEVELRVERDSDSSEPGMLRFSVRDTGIGIPPEKLDSVFDTFTQVDTSTTRRYGGTGLGLAISKRLVELMDGRIWVESRVGEGSTFSFTARFAVPAAPEPRRAPAPPDLAGRRILVVDDNATNRLLLRRMLACDGALVAEAGSGAAGLAELRRARDAGDLYQVVLLDGRMPDMDGFELVQRYHTSFGTLDTAVIMLTSAHRTGDVARARALGIASYLVKPIKRAELLETIGAVLSRRPAATTMPAHLPTAAESARGPVAGALPAADAPVGTGAERPLRILLVEDAEDNRRLVQFYLKDQPYQIDVAENGQVAVEKCTSERYDLVLMDLQMPVMDGYAATRAIREGEREHGREPAPIVALTADALAEHVELALEAGCTGYMTKPVPKAALLQTITQYAGISSS